MPRALGLVWTAARGWTTVWAVIFLTQGLLPVATVYLTRSLVNSLVAVIGGGSSWRPALLSESGSHEKLLARGGLYAQSWSAQVGYQPA